MVKSTVLYDLMRVEPTATAEEIRKAYLKLSAKVHPDKSDAPDAKECFMALKKAYDILKDAEKRARYDRTGATEEDSQSFQDAYERYRGVPLDAADIDNFLFKYRDSAEEEADLLAFLEERDGDVSMLLAHIMGSRDADIPRFVAFYEQALKKSAYKKYRKRFDPASIRSVAELEGEGADVDDDEEDEEEEDDDEDLEDMIDDAGEEEEEEEEGGEDAAHVPPPMPPSAPPAACPPGVDPALFAMFQKRQPARDAAFEAFASRAMAAGKAEAAAGKAKRAGKPKIGGDSGGRVKIGKSSAKGTPRTAGSRKVR